MRKIQPLPTSSVAIKILVEQRIISTMKLLLASAAFMVISAASGAVAEKVCSFYCVSFFCIVKK